MSFPRLLIPVIRELVHELVVGNYDKLESDGRAGRLYAEELRRAIAEYGRTLIDLPDQAFNFAEAFEIDGQENTWAVDVDLWTVEEGRGDLTLSADVRFHKGEFTVEITNLHVL